jgi:hypothetical protein
VKQKASADPCAASPITFVKRCHEDKAYAKRGNGGTSILESLSDSGSYRSHITQSFGLNKVFFYYQLCIYNIFSASLTWSDFVALLKNYFLQSA